MKKNLINIIVGLMNFGILSLLVTIILFVVNFLFSLVHLARKPTIDQALFFFLAFWIILVIYNLFKSMLLAYRMKKDPVFKRVYFQAGLSWKSYKRLRKDMKIEKGKRMSSSPSSSQKVYNGSLNESTKIIDSE